MVGSTRVRRDDLWSPLVEIGGKTAMYDLILSVAIESELLE